MVCINYIKDRQISLFLCINVCGCFIYFFVWKFLNVCYFNYVECKFDNALHLFLYFLNLLLLQNYEQPVWFAVPLHYFGYVHIVCLSLQTFQGLLKRKKKYLQNQLVLKVCTPLLLWKRKTNKQTTFFWVSVMPACSYMNSPDMLSSSFRVYYVESHDMNVHLVKVRYE